MALLVNPSDRALAQSQARDLLSAARERGMELHILNASGERDFDAVDVSDGYRLAGIYTGRVLKGESRSELPVVQPTKF